LIVQVPRSLIAWPHNKSLRASINNFGYGGSNAHVILEAPPTTSFLNGSSSNGHSSNGRMLNNNGHNADAFQRHHVYILSSKDSATTQTMARNLATYLHGSMASGGNLSQAALAYTLAERRSRFPWVAAVRANSLEELAHRLEEPALRTLHASKKPRLGFVFNGQGAQWYAMGRELIAAYPVFSDAIQRADQILRDYGATWSLYGMWRSTSLRSLLIFRRRTHAR
jgi:acyl transferase domain-containing protein